MKVSEWADRYRQLSGEASNERGQWYTSRAEYQRGMMDAIQESGVYKVVFMTSTQLGKSETLNNIIGYHADIDPCPMLLTLPTEGTSKDYVKERIRPMFRDTKSLKDKLKQPKENNDTLGSISFPAGNLTMASGSNAKTLRSKPKRIGVSDEVDGWPIDVDGEGDPVALIDQRLQNFFNSRHVLSSTSTIKGHSRVESLFEEGDQRHYKIPCPTCFEPHKLSWSRVIWDVGKPETARYECPHCGDHYDDAAKNKAVKKGFWETSAPFRGIASFHIWSAYSPWVTAESMVIKFLAAKGDPAKMKTFVNTVLGETWEESLDSIKESDLMGRAENYEAEVPSRVLVLTAGVDVQPDRLEVEVVGWAAGEESWSIDYQVIEGDPNIKEGQEDSPWDRLSEYLQQDWQHEKGLTMKIRRAFIDTGGKNTQAVYQYLRGKRGKGIYGIKGRGGEGVPIVGAMTKAKSGSNRRGVDCWIVGTDQAKGVVFQRLKEDEPGAGYCHFPKDRGHEWYRQMTSEKPKRKKVKGRDTIEWVVSEGVRNEAFDCRVYAYAALVYLNPRFDKLAFILKKQLGELKKESEREDYSEEALDDDATNGREELPDLNQSKRNNRRPKRRSAARKRVNFVNRW